MSPAQTGTLDGARVVLVNWRDPWHRSAGGSERYAWEFALALRGAGAAVEFWTARDRGQSASEVREGIRVRRRGGAYAFYAGALLRLARARLGRRSPDVVVDMDCGIPVFTPLVLGSRTPVVLVVHHVHQAQFRTAMPRPLSDLGRWLEARAMPAVYRDVPTIAVSASTLAEMREQLGWRGEVRVVHNGTDLPAPRSLPAPADGAGAGAGLERVVVLGRVVAHKRVDLVVRAFAQVVERHPRATLDLIGTGPALPQVVALIEELGLAGSVTAHGFLSEAEKSRVLGSAQLHVCASDAEGWGQVVLEAAAHGVPTLARDVPGMRDSVRDGRTGWLLHEQRDPDPERLVMLLADGIERSLDQTGDPASRRRIAGDCRAWAAGFGWDRMRAEAVDAVVRARDEAARSARNGI